MVNPHPTHLSLLHLPPMARHPNPAPPPTSHPQIVCLHAPPPAPPPPHAHRSPPPPRPATPAPPAAPSCSRLPPRSWDEGRDDEDWQEVEDDEVKEVFKDNEDDAGPRLNNDITAIFLRLVTDEGHDVIPRYKALQIAVRMGLDLVELLHVPFSFSVVCAQVQAIFISHGYLATRVDPPEIKPFR
ncbi:hypothetical protein ZWY2020_037831 [Hordeum vulgare]|nr:hypothetical protein ZWY2020_037831 [Hordeum vulgare]